MAEDGMLMNWELGDTAILAKPSFTGGKWKDRLSAKKIARHREGRLTGDRGSPKPDRAIFRERAHAVAHEEYIGEKQAQYPSSKRQRVERSVDGRNSASAAIISGKLPPGSINTGARSSAKKVFGDDDDHEISSNATATRRDLTSYPSHARGAGFQARDDNGKPQQVISSLFSFNPASKTKEDHVNNVTEPAEASNAPLSDEFSTFTNMGISKRLAAHLATKLEMKAPTAIQKAAVPQLIADDSDAFIQAETGSGKTLAYLLPIVERIMAVSVPRDAHQTQMVLKENQIHRDSGLFAIVLAPTRELCKQISTVLEKLLRCAPWIVSTTVMGGESKSSEKARLRKGVNVLIATPGRLADHLDNTEVLNVATVRWLVLDEGDRLMEMGFEEEVKKIVEQIGRRALVVDRRSLIDVTSFPKRRVTVLCSATMKTNVQKLGDISLKDAVHIKADPTEKDVKKSEDDGGNEVEAAFSAPAQLKQEFAIVPAKLRLVTLTALLKRAFARRGSVMKAILFISCADSVDFHFSLFSRRTKSEPDSEQPPVYSPSSEAVKDTVSPSTTFVITESGCPVLLHKLHGSLPQNIRSATLKSFSDSKDPSILICTDVASRGLDLPSIDYVIEYDPPFSAADHLHRVGRTARAGAAGRAMIFLLPGCEENYIPILSSGYKTGEKALSRQNAEGVMQKGFAGTGHEWEERATEWQLDIERWILDDKKALEMARRAYQSHIRAYATHIASERTIFDMKELHLGHLAKAFGLRDKPGEIRVPGLRPGKATKADREVAMRKKARAEKDGKADDNKAPEGERVVKERKKLLDKVVEVNQDDAARRMKRKMQEHMKGSTEFNIG